MQLIDRTWKNRKTIAPHGDKPKKKSRTFVGSGLTDTKTTLPAPVLKHQLETVANH
jgi:hypothetical protein